MSVLDELLQSQNQTYVPIKPLSLVEMKMASVKGKLAEKQQAQGLDPYAQYAASKEGGYDNTNLIDLAQASTLRSAGNITDFVKGASNRVFDTNFDDSENTGYSNSLAADQSAGVSPEYRQQLKQDQALVGQNVADGNYLEAAKNSANVGFRTLADSAGTIASLAAGGVLTGTAKLAGGFMANRAVKAISGAEGLKKRISNLKKGKEASSIAAETDGLLIKGIKGTPKAVSNVSLLVADMTQQDINSYRKEQGEDPSNARVGTMMLGHFLTSTMEVSIIKSLIMPDVKKGIIDEGKILLEGIKGSSNIKQIATRIIQGTAKVSAAAGGEAAQEYLQTWQSILTTKIGPEETDFLLQAVADEVSNSKNQNEALTGAFLGAGAGGAAKISTTGPAVALGSTTDVAKGVVKNTGKYVAKKLDEQSYKLMTQEDRDRAVTDYKRKSRLHMELKSSNDSKVEIIKDAVTFDDVTDESVVSDINTIKESLDLTTEQLKNPKVFKKVSNELQRMYKSDTVKSYKALESSRVAGITKQVAKNTVKITKEAAFKAAKVVKEKLGVDIEKAVVIAKDLGEAAVESVKTFESSAAAGVLERGVNITINSSKESIKALKKVAAKTNVKDLKKNYNILKESNPVAAKIIKEAAIAQDKATKRIFGDDSTQVNESNIPSSIKDVVSGETVIGDRGLSPSVLQEDINTAVYSNIADVETADTINKAIDVLRNSDSVVNGSDSVRDDVAILQRVLDNKKSKLKTREQIETKKKADEGKSLKRKVAEKVYDKATDFTVNTTVKAGEKLSKLYDTTANSIENWFDKAVKEKEVFVDKVSSAKLSSDIKRHGPGIDRYMKGLNNLKDGQELINLIFKSNFASALLNNFDFKNEQDFYNFINFYMNKDVKKALEEAKGTNDFKDSVLIAGKEFFNSEVTNTDSDTETATSKAGNELELENKLNDNNQKHSDSSEKTSEESARIIADEFNIKVCN